MSFNPIMKKNKDFYVAENISHQRTSQFLYA